MSQATHNGPEDWFFFQSLVEPERRVPGVLPTQMRSGREQHPQPFCLHQAHQSVPSMLEARTMMHLSSQLVSVSSGQDYL